MHKYGMIRVGVLATLALALMLAPLAADGSDLAGRAAAWQDAYNADDLDGVAALYAQDASRMPPNMETLDGPQGILANLHGFKDAGGAVVKLGVVEAESVGDMAWGVGTYEITGADGTHIDHGKWLNVSKRINGEWKIYCDIWNSNMPVPTP